MLLPLAATALVATNDMGANAAAESLLCKEEEIKFDDGGVGHGPSISSSLLAYGTFPPMQEFGCFC